jgi:hypothetical protein
MPVNAKKVEPSRRFGKFLHCGLRDPLLMALKLSLILCAFGRPRPGPSAVRASITLSASIEQTQKRLVLWTVPLQEEVVEVDQR